MKKIKYNRLWRYTTLGIISLIGLRIVYLLISLSSTPPEEGLNYSIQRVMSHNQSEMLHYNQRTEFLIQSIKHLYFNENFHERELMIKIFDSFHETIDSLNNLFSATLDSIAINTYAKPNPSKTTDIHLILNDFAPQLDVLINKLKEIDGLDYIDKYKSSLDSIYFFNQRVTKGIHFEKLGDYWKSLDGITMNYYLNELKIDLHLASSDYLHRLKKIYSKFIYDLDYRIYPERFPGWIYRGEHHRSMWNIKSIQDPHGYLNRILDLHSKPILEVNGGIVDYIGDKILFSTVASKTGKHNNHSKLYLPLKNRSTSLKDTLKIEGAIPIHIGHKSAALNTTNQNILFLGQRQLINISAYCAYLVSPQLFSLTDELIIENSGNGNFYITPLSEGEHQLLLKDKEIIIGKINVEVIKAAYTVALLGKDGEGTLELDFNINHGLIKSETFNHLKVTGVELGYYPHGGKAEPFQIVGNSIDSNVIQLLEKGNPLDQIVVKNIKSNCDEEFKHFEFYQKVLTMDEFSFIFSTNENAHDE